MEIFSKISVLGKKENYVLALVIWPGEFEDENTPFSPALGKFRPGIWPNPLSCHVGVGLLLLTFKMQVVHLIPGQLPQIELLSGRRQALDPRHSPLCIDVPPFDGVLNALPQPLNYVVVGLNPSLL